MSSPSPQPYFPSRRHWVKLWVKEWLTGTIRFELTPTQRGLFVDLLVLAGNSRTPGIISPGMNGETPLGYPISWLAGTLVCPEQELMDTITICEDQERIKVEKALDASLIITIVNWSKYQSEYLRQAKYKQGKRPKVVTPDVRDDVKLPAKSATAVPFPLKRKEGEVRGKKKEGESPPIIPLGGNTHEKVTPEFIDSMVTEFSPQLGGEQTVRGIITDAMNHKAILKARSEQTYLKRWLQRDAKRLSTPFPRSRPRPRPAEGGPTEGGRESSTSTDPTINKHKPGDKLEDWL